MNILAPIYDKLATLGTTYYETAPDDITYPYMTFRLDVPVTNWKTQDGMLVIDIWSNDVTNIETLRQSVWSGMDNYTYSDTDVSLWIRQELNNTVIDPDILRRQLRFIVKFEEA